VKSTDDEENEIKATTRIKKVKSKSVPNLILEYISFYLIFSGITTTKPRFDRKQYCPYKFRSEIHKFALPKKLMNLCLVVAERKSKKNGSIITTNEPEYYHTTLLKHRAIL